MTETVPLAHTIDEALDRFELVSGAGSEDTNTACVMTALAWAAGESWTDRPECAHRLLASWAISANDANMTTPEQRAELVRAGERGLLDTWWIPDTVVLGCMAVAVGDDHYAKTLDTCRLIEWWKSDKRRANLRWADLSSADLSWADLSSADLSSANLSWADLSSANLSSANLSSANLRWADLSSANLSSADLRSADLRWAEVSWADLRSADLRSADLSSANLRSANLRSANWNGFTLWPEGFDHEAATS